MTDQCSASRGHNILGLPRLLSVETDVVRQIMLRHPWLISVHTVARLDNCLRHPRRVYEMFSE